MAFGITNSIDFPARYISTTSRIIYTLYNKLMERNCSCLIDWNHGPRWTLEIKQGTFIRIEQEAGCSEQKGCSSFVTCPLFPLFSLSGLCWRSLSEWRHVRGPCWQIRMLLQGGLHRENMPGWHRCLQHSCLKCVTLLQRSHLCRWRGIELYLSVSWSLLETLNSTHIKKDLIRWQARVFFWNFPFIAPLLLQINHC